MAPLSTTCTLLGLLFTAAAAAGSLPAKNSSANFHFPQGGRVRSAASGSSSSPLFSGTSAGKNGSSVSPSRPGHFALLSYSFTKPSVNLDHADDTTVVVLDGGRSLRVDFHSQEAFDHAASTWSVTREEGLLLIAYAQGCGGHGHGERCFFDVHGIELLEQRRVVVARGRAAHPQDVSTGGETEWGWWTPKNSSSSTSSSSSSPSSSRLVKRGLWSSIRSFAEHLFTKGPSFSLDADKIITWALPSHFVHPGTEVNQLHDAGALAVSNSPWGGEAVMLYSAGPSANDDNMMSKANNTSPFLHVFCVDCGCSGRARIAGRAAWSWHGGLTAGHMSFQTDMLISLKVGIDARAGLRTEVDKELLMTDLPGLHFGIVSVDPHISVRARTRVDVAARGQLLAGAEMGLKEAYAVVDLVNSSKSDVGNWKPYLRPVLEAKGGMMLSAEMGLPVALECALRIGPWHSTVAIIDEPSVGADVTTVASVSRSRIWGGGGRCSGTSMQLSWRNSLAYRAHAAGQGGDVSLFDTGRRMLQPTCIPLKQREEAPKIEEGRRSKKGRW
ncbi:hypothetical protein CP532_0730 [Ophiocordyceps camponoti-leonardi (nom. inval.)]|nr:hypothetical protein CP532_0730 [Ophiocordyceps camponoti-leonardi (nom. inval.)]